MPASCRTIHREDGGGTKVPPRAIGVPRFELGTSPTRTERATRLRHTPSRNRLAKPQPAYGTRRVRRQRSCRKRDGGRDFVSAASRAADRLAQTRSRVTREG